MKFSKIIFTMILSFSSAVLAKPDMFLGDQTTGLAGYTYQGDDYDQIHFCSSLYQEFDFKNRGSTAEYSYNPNLIQTECRSVKFAICANENYFQNNGIFNITLIEKIKQSCR